MYTAEALFIYNIDKLKDAVDNTTEDKLFEAARILRHVLMDAEPLFIKANRTVKHKVKFIIQPMITPLSRPAIAPPPPSGSATSDFQVVFELAGDGFSPRMFKARTQKEVKLSEFLAEPVMVVAGHIAKVKDVIDYVANFGGAVHKNVPDSPITKALEDIGKTAHVLGAPSVLVSLRAIAAVTVDALEPIYTVLLAQQAAEAKAAEANE